MNSFRKVIATILTAIFLVQIFSSSVIAESPPNKMVNDTGVLQSDQKPTDDKSSPQIVNDKVSTDTTITPAAITSSAITSSSITPSEVASGTDIAVNPSFSGEVNEKAFNNNSVVTKTKRLIIKYKNVQDTETTKKSIANNSKLSGLKFKKSINASKFHVYELNDGKNLNNTISELKKDSNVEYVQEDKQLTPLDIPTDTYFSQQWSLQNMGQTVGSQAGTSGVDIDVLKAWDKTKGSPSVVVGVLDTGIDINHEDLKDNIYRNPVDGTTGWNFAEDNDVVYSSPDADKHGTHVSGIIAAAQNGKGVSGVSPNIKILPLKFISNGAGFTSDAISAIEYCKKNNVKIINCSWGSTEENPALKDEMSNSDILFICAGGNFGTDSAVMPVYPADFGLPNIVSVAAMDNAGNLASFSCYGSSVDVAAPGANIISTLPGNSYGLLSGTSMAAPEVTGIAALLLSSDPSMSAVDIANRIKKCVVASDKLNGKVKSGGRVDALAALEDIIPTSEPGTTPSSILILNNDQNKSIQDKLKATGENTTTPGDNGKILKPLEAEDVPSSGESKSVTSSVYEGSVASAVYNGLDIVRNDLNTQSFSALSYIMESEPNNSSSTAMPVSIGTVYGTISSSTDSDWYVVNLDANKQYIINLKGIQQGNDFDLYTFDPNLQDCGMSTYSGNSDENITINTTLAGYYYINVAHYIFASSGDHSYQLMIYPNSSQPDSYEPNDSQATAKLITSNTAISANINMPTDEDWYAVDIPSSGKKLTVTMTGVPSGCDYDLSIYNSSSTWIAGSYNNSNANEKTIALISTPGRYYIRVYSYSGYSSSSSYGLTTWVSTPDSYEINGDMYHAKKVDIGNSVLGTIDGPNNEDWYSVTVPNQESLQIGLQHIPQGCDYDLYVYDSSGNSVVASVYGGNTDELINMQFNQGTYYIRVLPYTSYSEVGQYTLSVSNQSALTISMPYVKTSSGSAIVVPVNISNLPADGICNFNFIVKYDKTKMTFTGFDAGSLTNTTNADISANDTGNGIVVLYADNSPSFNCPIKTAGDVIKLKFQLNSGIPDGAYVFGYNDGWDFGKPAADGGISDINQVLFKPGLATTGTYNTYGDDALAQSLQQPKMTVLDDSTQNKLGDINANGKIDSTDYTLYKRYIMGTYTFSSMQKNVADLNGDGNYNSNDSSILKRFILGTIDYFPVQNVALKNPAYSDVATSICDPAKGNDGSYTTSWSAAPSDTASHSWWVDLKANYNITEYEITWQAADAGEYQYKIQVSPDGTDGSWTNEVDGKGDKNLVSSTVAAIGVTVGRYVRVTFTGIPANKVVNMAEFAVFGTPATNVPSDLKVVSKSSDTVNLSWTAPGDTSRVTGYKIYKDNDTLPIGTVTGAGITFFSVTGLKSLKTYTFAVSAVLSDGNESSKSLPKDVEVDMVLTEDKTIEQTDLTSGTFNLDQCKIDLNGYKLTIKGSLVQSGGTIDVNNGELDVNGDYRIETADGSASSGILKMTQPNDCVKVDGSFVMHSTNSHFTYLTNGILEIKGDFAQKSTGGDVANFSPSQNHKTILDGPDRQTVTFESLGSSKFYLLEINKPLEIYKMPISVSAQSMSAGVVTMDTTDSQAYCEQLLKQYKSALGINANGGVDPATGGYSYNKTDMTVKMVGFDLPIGRTYSSLDTSTNNVLKQGWSFSLEGRIDVKSYTGNVKVLTVMIPQRGRDVFIDMGDGQYPGDGTRDKLEKSGNTYTLTTKDHYKYAYDASTYNLSWFEDKNGNKISVDYNTANTWKYTDVLNRAVVLDYTSSASITVTDYAGRKVTYAYLGKNLDSVTDPAGQVESYGYDLNGLLAQVSDNEGKLVVRVTYKQDNGKTKVDIYTNQLGKKSRYEYDNTKYKTIISDLADETGSFKLNSDLYWPSINSVAFGHGIFTGVGYGTIVISDDGKVWKQVGISMENNLLSVIWNGKMFVAVGDRVTAVSADGINWTYKNNDYAFSSVTWNGSIFVAVNGVGSATSTNGLDWSYTGFTGNSYYGLTSVTYGGSIFVAVGPYGKVAKSTNGVDWSCVDYNTNNNNNRMYGVTWNGDMFVAVGHHIIAKSTDGVKWSYILNNNYYLESVMWNGNMFVAVGFDAIETSTNGTDWTVRVSDEYNNDWAARTRNVPGFFGIAWNGSTFVAAGFGTGTSVNGFDWICTNRDQGLSSIVWNGNMFVAVGGGVYVATSKDGVKWTFRRFSAYNYSFNSVTWNGRIFVAVGFGVTATSMDGITWTCKRNDDFYMLNSVKWNGNMFVAVGNGIIVISYNGGEWTPVLSENYYLLNSVAWNGSMFVAVGDLRMGVSTDGVKWNIKDFPHRLNDIEWNGSKFIAVGERETGVSTDGANWTFTPTANYETVLYSVTWNESMFVAVGIKNGIYDIETSLDGTNWACQATPSSKSTLRGIVWNGSKFVIVGTETTIFTGTPTYTTTRQTTVTYNRSYHVTEIQDPGQKKTTIKYRNNDNDCYGDVSSITDRNGNTTKYDEIDDYGNIKHITNPDNSTRSMSYENNNLTMLRDENNKYTFYRYDSNNNLTKKIEPIKNVTDYVEANASDYAITQYDYYNNTQKGLLKTVTSPTYTVTNPDNTTRQAITVTTYDYYNDGNVKSETIKGDPNDGNDTADKVTLYHYNNMGLMDTKTSPKHYRTDYFYDLDGRLEKTVQNDGDGSVSYPINNDKISVTRILYDKEGRKSQEISPRLYDSTKDHLEQHSYDVQNVGTRYTYYDSGLVHTVTDAENNTTTYTYDVYGNMITKTLPNPNGSSTGPQPVYTYKYDEMNRLTNESWQDSVDATTIKPLENYTYEIVDGQTINGVIPKNQKKTTTKYLNNADTAKFVTVSDYAGRTIEQWDPAKPLLTEYYGNGELKSVTDKNGNKTYYYPNKYDSSTNTRYDEVYAPVDKDADGNIRYAYTRINYDGEHRKHIETTTVDKVALNSVTTATTIPQNSIVTTYDYYESGKLKSVRDNSGERTDYSYDDDGNLMTQDVYTSSTSFNRTSYINNYLGKPSQKAVSIRKGDLADFTYDTNDSFDIVTYYDYYTDGLLKNAKVLNTPTTSITIEYGYDNLGRQTSMKQPAKDENGTPVDLIVSTKYNYEGKPLTETDAKLNVTSYEYNQMGLPVKVKKATVTGGTSDIITQYDYDRAGRKTFEVSPANYIEGKACSENPNTTQYTYDAMDRLKTQKEVFKEKKIIEGTTKGTYSIDDTQTTTITAKAYQYDDNGNVIKELDALGFESASGTEDDKIANGYGKVYTYNGANKIESVVDAEGKYSNGLKYTTKYEYDALGRQITQTSVKGTAANTFYVSTINTYLIQENGNDKINTKTVSFKKASTEGGLASTPANTLSVSTYDNAGNLTKQTNYRNATTSSAAIYIYNALGKVSQAANPLDSDTTVKTTSQYDVMGNLIKQVNDMGTSSVTTDDIVDLYAYDNQGRQLLHKKQRGDGTEAVTVSAITVDLNGNKRFETDGNGYQKENTYDGLNRLVDTIERNIHSEDDEGILITHTTTNSYDKNNNLLTKTLQITSTKNSVTSTLTNILSSNLYDPINRLYEKKDANNKDAVIQMLDYNHNSLQATSYDVSTASAVFVTTTFTYDKNGRLLSTTDPKNHTTSQTYDYAGNIASKTDGRGNANSATKADHTTNYSYNEFDKLVKVTNAKQENTTYDYDWCGNMTGQTDGKTNKTIFEYNAANLMNKKVDPKGRPDGTTGASDDSAKTETYKYYGDGNIKSKTDRNGNTTSYTYKAEGWLLSQTTTAPSGRTQTISYAYDDNGNKLTMTDSSGTTTRTYDELNRVRSKSFVTSGSSGVNVGKYQYIYDIITDIDSDCIAEANKYVGTGEKTTKVYDPEGRLKYVKDGVMGNDPVVASYKYYSNGSTQSVAYGSNMQSPDASEEYTYYEDGTLNTLTNKKSGTAFETYSYSYDEARNMISKTDLNGTTQYGYDNLNRLQTVTEPGIKVTSYEYDAAGNRFKQTSGNTVFSYGYNEQNRLQSVTTYVNNALSQVNNFTYDNNGNQLTASATTTTNTYDLLNQLTVTTVGGTTVTNVYNGEGLRVAKTVNGTTTRYMYEYDNVVLETNGAGVKTARNIYGTNLLKRTVIPGVQQSMYYMYNGHADVTALIDASNKNTVGTYYYDAFGNLDTNWTTGTPNNSITYAGYQYDKDTGLYYCNARMYDPKIARFVQEDDPSYGDPSDPLSLNLYTYCQNEPIMYYDPTGHLDATTAGSAGSVVMYTFITASGETIISTVPPAALVAGGAYVSYKVISYKLENDHPVDTGGVIDGSAIIVAPIYPTSSMQTNISVQEETEKEKKEYQAGQAQYIKERYTESQQETTTTYSTTSTHKSTHTNKFTHVHIPNNGVVDDLPRIPAKPIILPFPGTTIKLPNVFIFTQIPQNPEDNIMQDPLPEPQGPIIIQEPLPMPGEFGGNVFEASNGERIINRKGIPYPQVEVEGYGEVELPAGPYVPNNTKILRPKFTDAYKKQFKEWWISQGHTWPDGEVNIHHIKPLSKGGDNSFENLVPLVQPQQHQPFTNWWRSYP